MKTTKYLSTLVLVLLSLLLTTFTFAYWVGSISPATTTLESDANTVTIGEAGEVETIINVEGQLTSDKKLVPVNRVHAESEISEVSFPLTIDWKHEGQLIKQTDEVNGELVITSELSIDGVDQAKVNDMFTVHFSKNNTPIRLNHDQVEVNVTVRFVNEPESKAIYEQVINEELGLKLTVAANPINQ